MTPGKIKQEQKKREKELQKAFNLIPKYRLNNSLTGYLSSFKSKELLENISYLGKKLLPLNSIGDISSIFNNISKDDLYTKKLINIIEALSTDIDSLTIKKIESLKSDPKYKDKMLILKLRSDGMTLQEIGINLGVSRERVRQLIVEVNKPLIQGFKNIEFDILMFISADLKSAHIITTSEMRNYFINKLDADLFLYVAKRQPISKDFKYDDKLDAYCHKDIFNILGDMKKAINALPYIIGQDNKDEIINKANLKLGFPLEEFTKVFNNIYKTLGKTYYRGNLALTRRYNYILEHHYPNGMKIYDENELRNFRKIATDIFDGKKLPANNRAIEARLADISILSARGVYIHPNHVTIEWSLIDEVRSYIINLSRDAFPFNALYEHFKYSLLLRSNVNNRYFLQGVLKYYFGDSFTFTKDTISKDKDIDLESEIENFIRKRGEIDKSVILAEFSGITEIMFATRTASNRNIISTSDGSYMHADQLTIEPNDYSIKETIERYTKKFPVSSRKIFEIIELTFPEFLSRNNITNHGKLFGVLRFMFDKEFAFRRPYIARLGTKELTNIKVIKQHLKSYDSIRISELIKLCKDHKLLFPSIRTLCVNLSDEFLRIDSETLTRSNIKFSDYAISKIRNIIMEMINFNGYLVASKVENYMTYPKIGYEWNPFLLRSIVEKYMSDSIGIIDIPTSDISLINSIFIDPALGVDNYKSFLRSLLKSEHVKKPFTSINEVINWLQQKGLFLRTPPKCLLDNSIISIEANGNLIIE